MESCVAVEREVDRVLSKFGGLRDHSKKNLEELISSIQNIQRELNGGEIVKSFVKVVVSLEILCLMFSQIYVLL